MVAEGIREKNKREVVETALYLFVKKGISDTKISEIAQEVGLADRSIYRYFETKSELVFQAAMLFWEQTTTQAEEAFMNSQKSGKTGAQQIQAVLFAYSCQYFDEKEKLIFEQEAELYLFQNDKKCLFENKPPANYGDSTDPLAKAIQNGVKDGSVRSDIDLEILYYNTYNSLLGLMHKMVITECATKVYGSSAEKRLQVFCGTLLSSFMP